MTLGDWIRVKRREKHLTRFHLANRMGISTTLVRSWESGNGQPCEQQLKTVEVILGIVAPMLQLASYPTGAGRDPSGND